MSKVKFVPDLKPKSGKVRNHDSSINSLQQDNRPSITKTPSKIAFDESLENKHTNQVTTVKETGKYQKNLSNSKVNKKNLKQNNEKKSNIKHLITNEATIVHEMASTVRQSVDSTDALIALNSNVTSKDPKRIKEKWKEAARMIRKNLRIQIKYEDFESDDENLSSSDLRLSLAGRRSTVSTINGVNQRRYTKESTFDSIKFNEKQFNNNNSYMRSVIPCLPVYFASICFILNIVLPGLGTLLSGILVFIAGKPRIESKSNNPYFLTFMVNAIVGVCQLSTVILFLVGWFWSFGWGVYLMAIALERRRVLNIEKLEKKHQELQKLKSFGDQRSKIL